jgi:DNA-binding NtrC family response regulator
VLTRVGGNRPRPVDVRIVYATHRDLSVFREDIRYRVTSHALYLKPLRQRKEEIVPLAMGFLDGFNAKSGRRIRADRPVLNLLENDPWFGNIRELRTFVEKVCVDAIISLGKAAKSPEISLTLEILENRLNKKVNGLDHSPSSPVSPGGWPPFVAGDKLEEYLERIETELLKAALENHKHNQTRAARELGVSRSGLIKKLKRMEHRSMRRVRGAFLRMLVQK